MSDQLTLEQLQQEDSVRGVFMGGSTTATWEVYRRRYVHGVGTAEEYIGWADEETWRAYEDWMWTPTEYEEG